MEQDNPYRRGDIVQLLSGGPNMTVAHHCDLVSKEGDPAVPHVTCVWFTTEHEVRSMNFDVRLVRLAGSKLN